jgi:hypothetical protein
LLVFTFCFSSISCALKLAFGLLCHHHYHGLSLVVKYHYTLHQEKAALCTKVWVGFGQFRLLVNLWSSSAKWSSQWVSSRVSSEPVAVLSRVKPWVVGLWLFLASSEPVVEQSKVKGLTMCKWDGFWLIQASSKHVAKQSEVKAWASLQGWLGWFQI